uniref:Uncharacterized protein n=1 Tax=Chromera velia CCMP2878 TaxID=1169474 RepID=A0A0G4GLL2_9ALVE|eukprot:Cvel_22437.t1-p1 / transcript=Cvel_22437.t1 / gene=Cvel_22437 / organism=Chromera_velia_CCMP2878 / gene_product=hypothetical protein / transcript_product=hypothetical protein / location=Cvel_scaffold2204:20260-21585(+) / protein_length=177 / sequence_SO=supercontig / SO=protein_coding / is_pseudo=false
MSWENYGSLWHVDHIVPIQYRGADGRRPDVETVISRLHYSNLQPMWSEENRRKGNRFMGKPPPLLPLSQQVRSTSCLAGQVDIKEPPGVPKTRSTVWGVGNTRFLHSLSWLVPTARLNRKFNDRLSPERALGVRVAIRKGQSTPLSRQRSHEYLGCSFPDLKAHLEKDDFHGNPGMS